MFDPQPSGKKFRHFVNTRDSWVTAIRIVIIIIIIFRKCLIRGYSIQIFVTFDCGLAIYARLTALITVERFNNHDNDAVTLSYARKKVHRCNIYGPFYYF